MFEKLFFDVCRLGEFNADFKTAEPILRNSDIISFDYSMGNELNGDIFVSVERVLDNAQDFNVSFEDELKRVLVHGVLHYCGYKDKSPAEEIQMRHKEEEKMALFPLD